MVRIVTDSTSDLPQALLKEFNIKMVPLNVHFDSEVFKDQVELSPDEFFRRLPAATKVPSTSQPSPGEFMEAYKEVGKDGESIVSIHISQEMSGTYQSAVMAKNMLPDLDIEVIDSRFVSLGLGAIVFEAARAAQKGATKEEVVRLVKDLIPRVTVLFCVDTLHYLEKNGRIGKARSFLGTMLNIKPVLGVTDGVIVPVEKVRGKKKGLARLTEHVKKATKDVSAVNLIMMHGNAHDEAAMLLEELKGSLPVVDGKIVIIGSVVGVHAGPGVVGVVAYPAIPEK
jgi:DegV family protein with EDD domain